MLSHRRVHNRHQKINHNPIPRIPMFRFCGVTSWLKKRNKRIEPPLLRQMMHPDVMRANSKRYCFRFCDARPTYFDRAFWVGKV